MRSSPCVSGPAPRALLLFLSLATVLPGSARAECEEDGYWHPSPEEVHFRQQVHARLGAHLPPAPEGWEQEPEGRLVPFRPRCEEGRRPPLTLERERGFRRPVDPARLEEALSSVAPTPEEEAATEARRERQREAALALEAAVEAADFERREELERELLRLTEEGSEERRGRLEARREAVRPLLEDSRARVRVRVNEVRWHLPREEPIAVPGATRAYRTRHPLSRSVLHDDRSQGLLLLLGPWEEGVRDERRALVVPRRADADPLRVHSLVVEVDGTRERVDALVEALDLPHLMARIDPRGGPAARLRPHSRLAQLVDRPGDLDLVLEGGRPAPVLGSMVLRSPEPQQLLERLGRDIPALDPAPEGGRASPDGSRAGPGSSREAAGNPGEARAPEAAPAEPPGKWERPLARVTEELAMLQEELRELPPSPRTRRLARRLGNQVEILRELLAPRAP